ncbi:MAG: ATP-grasp domain-containing protein [Elusimicrobia bacterium]|nr:ATP-grasp domain-containing protein [Elusimicrobiota bacterium]
MNKVLLLGGSHLQVPSVKKAKELGYYTITCDYLPNNPGHKFADEYHNVSTTDKEAVLKLAKKLKIDGIVCYASDPAAPTAAYVAEKMGLPGQPYKSVEILSDKELFRNFLTENNFNVPRTKGYSSIEQAKKEFKEFKLPVMVKPVDSSGSKGVTKISKYEKLEKSIEYALSFSRVKRFIIEEFIEKDGYQIAGDGFSVNGKLVFRCFANDHFILNNGNLFVPTGASFPSNKPLKIHNKVHNEIQRLFTLLNMKTGAYNFDIMLDKNENVFLMEIGARNGGNLIPQVIEYATGVDIVEYTIQAAIGKDCSNLKMVPTKGFWAYYAVHSKETGNLKAININEELKKNNIVEQIMMCNIGDNVNSYIDSTGTLGIMILKFSSMDEMLYKMDNMDKFIQVIAE